MTYPESFGTRPRLHESTRGALGRVGKVLYIFTNNKYRHILTVGEDITRLIQGHVIAISDPVGQGINFKA